jgi:hypothetical protein
MTRKNEPMGNEKRRLASACSQTDASMKQFAGFPENDHVRFAQGAES